MNEPTEIDHYPVAASDPLDERMRRLENAIAALQDTRMMEERVQQPSGSSDDANALVAAGRSLLPGMMRAVGAQLGAATSPTAPGPTTSFFSARTWLLTDMIQEVRTFFVLYFDYRYKATWSARILPPTALVVFLLSWLLLRSFLLPPFGALIDYAVNFFLIVLVYKVLQREAARYRSQVSYLPPI